MAPTELDDVMNRNLIFQLVREFFACQALKAARIVNQVSSKQKACQFTSH